MIPEPHSPNVPQYPAASHGFLLSTRWQQNIFLQPWRPVQGEQVTPAAAMCRSPVQKGEETEASPLVPVCSRFPQQPSTHAGGPQDCLYKCQGLSTETVRCYSELPHSPPSPKPFTVFSIPSSSPRPTSNPRSVRLAPPPQVHFPPPLRSQDRPPPPSPGPANPERRALPSGASHSVQNHKFLTIV